MLRGDGTRFEAEVSTAAYSDDVGQALAAGFDGYLTKPLTAAALVGELRRTLRHRRVA